MNLLYSYRFLFCYTLLVLHAVSAQATTITWSGFLGTPDWHSSANWIGNVVPTLTDSVFITGGSSVFNTEVEISNNTAVRHITIDEYCKLTTSPSTILEVTDASGDAIRIEENGTFLNKGTANVFNAPNGIYVLGNFENEGDCIIDAAGNGVHLQEPGSMLNEGTLLIRNSLLALRCSAQYINEGTMNIQDCTDGIFADKDSNIKNIGSMTLDGIAKVGLRNNRGFTNDGSLIFKNIGNPDSGIAISNERIIIPLGPGSSVVYSGDIINNATIFITDVKGTAIVALERSTFLNLGTVWVQDATDSGLVGLPVSKFDVADDSFLIIRSIGTPLEIQQNCFFEVAVGGSMTIRN